jgi:phosphoadenosine phosphosulfate reductase
MTTTTNLRKVAEEANDRLADASAQEILAWAREIFGDKLVVTASMADGALPHLAAEAAPGVDVLFLDTGYHFAETIGTRDAVEHTYDVRIVNATPEHTVAQQDSLLGKDLFARDPNQCCALRKVVPLERTLAGYDAWVTGVRRIEAPTRANTPLVTYDEKFGLVKVNPIAAWSDEEMDDYIAEHGILVNPLVAEGYPSIGCAPCTAKPAPGADKRSGRWAGTGKIECGLHVS